MILTLLKFTVYSLDAELVLVVLVLVVLVLVVDVLVPKLETISRSF